MGSWGGSQGSHWNASTRPWNSVKLMGFHWAMSLVMFWVSAWVWKELSRFRSKPPEEVRVT